MVFDVALGRCDQGFVPETLRASGAFPGLVFSDPILTDVTTPPRKRGGFLAALTGCVSV
jgi:hypothetical protein